MEHPEHPIVSTRSTPPIRRRGVQEVPLRRHVRGAGQPADVPRCEYSESLPNR
jgi:hypothetical protein